jgi:hypothetical protein
MRSHRIRAAVCLLSGPLVLACGRSESPSPAPPVTVAAVRVTEVVIGRSLNPDKTIADSTDDFKPADTIYASVKTEGSAASATLTARWSYEDNQRVDESTQTIAPTGAAVTEFHISKPDGWPTGKYKVEVLLNGASAGTREFEVK